MTTRRFDLIYKRTSTGAVQQWTIEVEGNKYRTISGQVDGKQKTSKWTEAFGKNIGKTNETTGEDQAVFEAQSKRQKKLDKHYYENVKDIDKDKFVKAMLAHDLKKYPEIEYPVFCQPKLDGIRCLVSKDGMFTRGGKPIVSAPHIFEALKPVFEKTPNFVFDGELYTHALKEDFNKIVSLAKRSKPTTEDLAESKEHLQYWVYDVANMDETGFFDRNQFLCQALKDVAGIVLVPTFMVANKNMLDKLYQEYLSDGMEGQMIRQVYSPYVGKRTKFLLKRKEFQDTEYVITGIEEGKGDWAGYAKRVFFKTQDGQSFGAGVKGTQEYCKEVLQRADELVGKEATVRFQNLTPDGIPRFPVCYTIHETKRW